MTEPAIPSRLLPAVLRKAAELQRSTDLLEPESGLTLEEILQIGAEVGLPAEALAAAARSVGQAPGATSEDCFETVVPTTLSDTDIAEMVALLRRATGTFGEVTDEAGTVVWSSGSSSAVHVNFVREEGRTLIQVLSNYGRQVAPMHGLFATTAGMFLMLMALAYSKGDLGPGFLAFLSTCLAGTGVAWAGVRHSLKSGQARIRALTDQLGREARRLLPAAAADRSLPPAPGSGE